jgi:ribosomal protein L11 methyltransferase
MVRPILRSDNDEQVHVARENAVLNESMRSATSFMRADWSRLKSRHRALRTHRCQISCRAASRIGRPSPRHTTARPCCSVVSLVEQADEIVDAYSRGFAPERHIDLETGGEWWRTLLLRRT